MTSKQSIERICAALESSGVSPESAARFTYEARDAWRVRSGLPYPICDWRWGRALGLLRRRAQAGRDWMIQRCTQRWIGTELQYEDWPLRPGAVSCGQEDLMSHAEMLRALGFCNKRIPQDEFRGHNVARCRCPEHERLKASSKSQIPNPKSAVSGSAAA